MKLLYSFLFLLLMSVKINAQNILPKAYEITTDTIKYSIGFPDSCWQILADKDSKWTIEQVSSLPVANGFLKPTEKTTKPDFSIYTYWCRYILKNTMNKDVDIWIGGGYDKDEIFTKDSAGQWDHQLSGILQPWSKVDGYKIIRAMPVTIPSGKEVLIYERLTSNYRLLTYNSLNEGFFFKNYLLNGDDGLIAEFNFNAVFFSLILGVLVFAALLNFIFFLMVRERLYLYFALFVASIGLHRYAELGFLSTFFFREQPWIGYSMSFIALPILAFSIIQFSRNYLNTKKYFPRWDKFLLILSIYTPLISIAYTPLIGSQIGYDLYLILAPAAFLSYGASLLIMVITYFLYIRRSERYIRLVVIAGLPILLYWVCLFGDALYGILLTKIFGWTEPSIFNYNENRTPRIEQLSAAWFAVIFSWILLLRFIQLRKEVVQQSLEKERLAKEKEIEKSQLIAQQKIELEKTVEARTAELKHSLNELKSTQAQLIQSEKMASLGELTAGIAHEIQNPLNFVNNFSEVNKELLVEMKDEIDKGNIEDAKAIADDVIENQKKINLHGKRADSIVKGMLQHSRASSGQRELTDINKLADEYLRLSYHGTRAKDKSFNAEMKTEFDESIGKLNVVPQDIGRVLLNLFNNAFYAVNEKRKTAVEDYQPTVSVQTKKLNDKVEIRVSDNGPGIPQNIVDKIFQPFFTTKPTGQGTGLGLSLAYDIIKAHGGEIKVETKEGEGSEFAIQLPLQI